MADAAALVVDGDQQVRTQHPQHAGEFADLVGVADIAGEQDDPAESAVDQPFQGVGDGRRTVEARDEAAVGCLVEGRGEDRADRPGGGVFHLRNPLADQAESQQLGG